jgi:primosomal protein N' (replication factor Y)
MCTLGEVMRIALPSLAKPSATSLAEIDERSITPPVERYVALTEELRSEEALLHYVEKFSRRAPRRTAAMEAIASMAAERRAEDGFVARRLLNIDNATFAALRKQGLVSEEVRPRESVTNNAAADFLLPTLSPAQCTALEGIRAAHREGRVALLHGITGSGKTEIYIQLMAEVLSAGGDVLMLVPEIAITSQLIERLERIFEGRTTSYHSRLTALRRGRTFLRMATSMGGELIVGVRSSIFLPLNKLSLIIVDEEHDPSYKQSDMQPRYNARDCAVVVGRIFGARVVLGSATPSLESYLNALSQKYAYVPLNERWGESILPEIVVSDTLRAVKRGERRSHFNLDLLNSIGGSIERGEQVILFQNRRGYAPFVQCRSCGYTPRCPHCNVTLTQHKGSGRLECHYCGYNTP